MKVLWFGIFCVTSAMHVRGCNMTSNNPWIFTSFCFLICCSRSEVHPSEHFKLVFGCLSSSLDNLVNGCRVCSSLSCPKCEWYWNYLWMLQFDYLSTTIWTYMDVLCDVLIFFHLYDVKVGLFNYG